MRLNLVILVYGMMTLVGCFLAAFWSSMAWARFRRLRWSMLKVDRYFWLASSLAMFSVGSMILFGARTHGNIVYGISNYLMRIEGIFIILGASVILVSQMMMVWLADLERGRPVWLWGALAITVLWTCFVYLWY